MGFGDFWRKFAAAKTQRIHVQNVREDRKGAPENPSWWLNQPIWKILVKMGIFPK